MFFRDVAIDLASLTLIGSEKSSVQKKDKVKVDSNYIGNGRVKGNRSNLGVAFIGILVKVIILVTEKSSLKDEGEETKVRSYTKRS